MAKLRPEPLSDSDRLWLSRLPSDPGDVSLADAANVAALLRSLPDGAESDRRLLNSVWKPIKRLHDIAAARVELDNATRPPPPIPDSAVPAMAAALTDEHPGLAPDVAHDRARQAIALAMSRRADSRERRIRLAQARLDDLEKDSA